MEHWAVGMKSAVRNCKKDNTNTEDEMDCIWAIISSIIGLFTMAQAKINRTVFGVLTDSETYLFVLLDSNRKAFVSLHLYSATGFNSVVSFLDRILRDAIDLSPHTTPTKRRNTVMKYYGKHLSNTYTWGNGSSGMYEDCNFQQWDIIDVDGSPDHVSDGQMDVCILTCYHEDELHMLIQCV